MLWQCLQLGARLSRCLSTWLHSVKVYNFMLSIFLQMLDTVGGFNNLKWPVHEW